MRRLALPAVLAVVSCLYLPAQTVSKDVPPPNPATPAMQVQTDLNRLMRGVLYPAANVVFYAQSENPGDVKPIRGQDPSLATDPLTSTFGRWTAVENAALALSESANLLLIPGRKCGNGVPAPIDNPDWSKFVLELRETAMKAYAAAQSKSVDKMAEISEPLSVACAGCHKQWRDRRSVENRCK
jgi:hypothetical protein